MGKALPLVRNSVTKTTIGVRAWRSHLHDAQQRQLNLPLLVGIEPATHSRQPLSRRGSVQACRAAVCRRALLTPRRRPPHWQCFEPSLDYCVVKFPRWDLNK